MDLIVQPLTAEAFSPFGDLLEVPALGQRQSFNRSLQNARPLALPRLSLSRRAPICLPLTVVEMERHRWSSQTFLPLDGGRMLVIVANSLPDDRAPDLDTVRAFACEPGQGVTYAANVWHHPSRVIGCEASLAVLVWGDGTPNDEQFVSVTPFTVHLPAAGASL